MTDSRNLTDNRLQTEKLDKNKLLEKRMLKFAADVIRFCQQHRVLPDSVVSQVIRASASIGANYAEACNASSKLDFRNKIYIAKKEAAESRYWLDLIKEVLADNPSADPLRQEAHELLVILQTIANSLKRSDK